MPAPPIEPPLPTPSSGGSSFHNARTANEMLKAQERKLQLDERRGQLVEKARALMLVHRLAKEERDAILARPSSGDRRQRGPPAAAGPPLRALVHPGVSGACGGECGRARAAGSTSAAAWAGGPADNLGDGRARPWRGASRIASCRAARPRHGRRCSSHPGLRQPGGSHTARHGLNGRRGRPFLAARLQSEQGLRRSVPPPAPPGALSLAAATTGGFRQCRTDAALPCYQPRQERCPDASTLA
jgi:hypothetical protein